MDEDLAKLYGVETRVLNQAVKRNINRFPEDFMFQLTKDELEILKSQFVISSWGGRRKLPSAFTEHGVLMLSSVLNSERAIAVNIRIMRIFNKLRAITATNREIMQRLDELEQKFICFAKDTSMEFDENNKKIQEIFIYIQHLMDIHKPVEIGFKT